VIEQATATYGPESADRLAESAEPGMAGARAALETFYYSLNNRDADVLTEIWTDHPFVQLNNPVGGILHGRQAIGDLYRWIFQGQLRLHVTFGDIVEFTGDGYAVFAGRETGGYTTPDGEVPLKIRTTRYFRYDGHAWRQEHHHGSIDDPAALDAYQRAARGEFVW
jgi:hypothetical protein